MAFASGKDRGMKASEKLRAGAKRVVAVSHFPDVPANFSSLAVRGGSRFEGSKGSGTLGKAPRHRDWPSTPRVEMSSARHWPTAANVLRLRHGCHSFGLGRHGGLPEWAL